MLVTLFTLITLFSLAHADTNAEIRSSVYTEVVKLGAPELIDQVRPLLVDDAIDETLWHWALTLGHEPWRAIGLKHLRASATTPERYARLLDRLGFLITHQNPLRNAYYDKVLHLRRGHARCTDQLRRFLSTRGQSAEIDAWSLEPLNMLPVFTPDEMQTRYEEALTGDALSRREAFRHVVSDGHHLPAPDRLARLMSLELRSPRDPALLVAGLDGIAAARAVRDVPPRLKDAVTFLRRRHPDARVREAAARALHRLRAGGYLLGASVPGLRAFGLNAWAAVEELRYDCGRNLDGMPRRAWWIPRRRG